MASAVLQELVRVADLQELVGASAVWQQLVGANYCQRLVVVADLKQLWISIALRSLYSSRLCSTWEL